MNTIAHANIYQNSKFDMRRKTSIHFQHLFRDFGKELTKAKFALYSIYLICHFWMLTILILAIKLNGNGILELEIKEW